MSTKLNEHFPSFLEFIQKNLEDELVKEALGKVIDSLSFEYSYKILKMFVSVVLSCKFATTHCKDSVFFRENFSFL